MSSQPEVQIPKPKKLSATEQRFQEWLTAFRAGKHVGTHVFLADESHTDDQLRVLWKDAIRVRNKYLNAKPRPRRPKYPILP